MAAWLRPLAALPEDSGSIPSPHVAADSNSNSKGFNALSVHCRHGTYMVQTYMQETPIHKIKWS